MSLAHIGDFIVSLAALQTIRAAFPDANITLLCAPWNVQWASELGWFDEVVPFQFFPALNRDWAGASDQLFVEFAALQLGKYDLAIDLRHDTDTRPCLYRVDATYRVGFEARPEPGKPYMDIALPSMTSSQMHAEVRLQLLAACLVETFSTHGTHPVNRLVESSAAAPSPYVIFALGAGDPIRYWPVQSYIELGRHFVDQGYEVFVAGGKAETEALQAVSDALPSGKCRMLLATPLAQLPGILSGAALFVGNGSGLGHLAAALGTPTIAVMTGTNENQVWYPRGPRSMAMTSPMPCAGCGLRFASDCSYDVACLRSITPAQVIAASQELMQGDRHPVPSALQ